MCTEKAALAQNILALLGFETYYCSGAFETEDNYEAHAFNIVKAKNEYRIVDTSQYVFCYKNGKETFKQPFIGSISNEMFEEVIKGETSISCPNYSYVDGVRVEDGYRTYDLNIDADKLKSKTR